MKMARKRHFYDIEILSVLLHTVLMQELFQNIKRLKQTIDSMRVFGNPEMFLRAAIERSPNGVQAIEYVEENGGDPKSAFFRLAKENHIDPQEIINLLR